MGKNYPYTYYQEEIVEISGTNNKERGLRKINTHSTVWSQEGHKKAEHNQLWVWVNGWQNRFYAR